jgi:hypothetical protein
MVFSNKYKVEKKSVKTEKSRINLAIVRSTATIANKFQNTLWGKAPVEFLVFALKSK